MATLRVEILRVGPKEVRGLLGMSSRNVMEGGRRNIVRLTFADQGIILQQVLYLGIVTSSLRAQNLSCFRSNCQQDSVQSSWNSRGTHSDIFSNLRSSPKALLAAAASSSPVASIGPKLYKRTVIDIKALESYLSES